jgi:hypothetical protein
VLNRVRELVADVTVRASPATPVPLLFHARQCNIHVYYEVCAYPMPHQTLFIIHRARIPLLKIGLAAFTPTHGHKIEEDGSDASSGG